MIWNADKVEILEHEIGAFSISVLSRLQGGLEEWIFSGVYGPTLRGEVDDFLNKVEPK